MLSTKIYKYIFAFGILLIVVSLLSLTVFAANYRNPESNETAKEENSALFQQIQSRMNALLTQFGVTAEASDQAIVNAIINADGDILRLAMDERLAMEQEAMALSEAEVLRLQNTELLGRFDSTMEALYSPLVATTVSIGDLTLTDTQNTGKEVGGTYTATAKGSLLSKKTNEITITNNSGKKAILAFDYSIDKADSFTIDGGGKDYSSGTYEKILDHGESIEISITSNSGFSNLTVTLTIKNISLTEPPDFVDVTVIFDSDYGGVTVDGVPATSGEAIQISDPSKAVTFVATQKNGASFVGWFDTDNKLLSSEKTYESQFTQQKTIHAMFSTTAMFLVDGTLYDNLNTAASVAASSTKLVILANTGTLPSGNYTIPADVTLLIPFDTANTLYTTKPETEKAYKEPTPFRTLTMESGAEIEVKNGGAISVSGKHSSQMNSYNGAPFGPLGFIQMKEGSNIIVNGGGKLYAWGYIVGEKRSTNAETPKGGTVTIKSGATVYECFQVTDYRGGTATDNMTNDPLFGSNANLTTYHVFPMSQYYVQNVQVPMTLEAGATEKGYFSVNATLIGNQSAEVPFIGDNGMFRIASGSITKDYDEKNDRMVIDINGDLTMAPMKISSFGINIDANDFVLPLTNNITATLHSGYELTITQDLAILPGAELIIEEDAKAILGTGKCVYAYDLDQWTYTDNSGALKGYCSEHNKVIIPINYAYDLFSEAKRTASILEDAKIVINGIIDATKGFAYSTEGGANIYSTGSGKAIVGTIGTNTVTYQAKQGSDKNTTDINYLSINIDSAKLKNADGSFTETATATTETTYTYLNGFWHIGTDHTYGAWEYVTDPFDSLTLAGKRTHTCDTCGEEEAETLNELALSANIKVADSLDMYFYLSNETVEALTAFYEGMEISAVITRSYDPNAVPAEEPHSVPPLALSAWEDAGTAGKRFGYFEIAAKEMTDNLHVEIVAKGNAEGSAQILVHSLDYSVQQYAMGQLALITEESKLATALVDMLNYGAAAQDHFDYNTDNFANSKLTGTQAAWATGDISPDMPEDNGNLYAASVSAWNNLMYTFYFDLSEYTQEQISGAEVSVSYKHYTGNDGVFQFEKFHEYGSRPLYGVDVRGIFFADGKQTMTCTLEIGGDTLTATDSIEGYIARAMSVAGNDDPVYSNLMRFIMSTNEYFSKAE